MTIAMGTMGSIRSLRGKGGALKGERGRMVICAAARGLKDQYRTLRIQPGASEKEVKKAFRQLALQYHPDVCKESDCGVEFNQIYEAYEIVMSNVRASEEKKVQRKKSKKRANYDADEPMRGMHDPSWDLWEEWMGWEGAGIRDYSSHINPYI